MVVFCLFIVSLKFFLLALDPLPKMFMGDSGFVPTEWQIVGTDDFNGDGRVDILWQNSNTGQRFIWFMTGAQHISGADLGFVPTLWDIRNH